MESHMRLERSGWLVLLREVAGVLSGEALKKPAIIDTLGKVNVSPDKVADVLGHAELDIGEAHSGRRVSFHPATRKALVGVLSAAAQIYNGRLAVLQGNLLELSLIGVVGIDKADDYDDTRREIEAATFEQYSILAKLRTLAYAIGVMTKMANARFELI